MTHSSGRRLFRRLRGCSVDSVGGCWMSTKVKDGLFIGDGEASQNLEFLEPNRVLYIINCAGRELPNLWASHGVRYLTFQWDSAPVFVLFDAAGVVLEQIGAFVDEGLAAGDSVLIHDMNGVSRCVTAVIACVRRALPPLARARHHQPLLPCSPAARTEGGSRPPRESRKKAPPLLEPRVDCRVVCSPLERRSTHAAK